MPEPIPAEENAADSGLPGAEDAASLASIEGTPQPEDNTPAEPVNNAEPAEPVQAGEPAVDGQEPVAPAPVTDPNTDAALIVGQNTDLINQIQTLLPQQAPVETPQTPANSAEPQLGTEGQKSVFEFDEEIANNVLENPLAFAENIAQVVAQHVVAEAPGMINNTLQANEQSAQQYQEIANNFYGENPELVGHEQTVRAVAEQLTLRFPTIAPAQLLAATAQMVKGHIQKEVQVTETPLPGQKIQQLGAAGNAGEVSQVPQLSEQDQEFADTLAYAQKNSISL